MSYVTKLILVVALFAPPVFAATIVVGPPPASIQTAINSAASGDTVQLSAGTYVQEFQVVSKSLTIVGAGQNATIVQAPGPATRLTQSFTESRHWERARAHRHRELQYGPVITMNADAFTGTTGNYIQEVAAPNDIWPSTATVLSMVCFPDILRWPSSIRF